MVDDKRKCVFIHIPKCAGNSMVDAFGVHVHSHQPANYYWREKKILNYYLFTFVRNPWDRFLSAYLFLKDGGINDVDKLAQKNLIKGRDFEEFLLDTPVHEILQQVHFKRLTHFLNRKVDFVGKYENLDADFKQLLINIKADDIELPHLNATRNKKHYTEYYNDKTIKAIKRLYFRDIKLFNYEFGK